ncbi:beta-propeller fold lactonase family protein [Paenibacillus aceris]|uniref:6-phosphogluconolactonase n=1 Tax=Paenibacillus aceris TaxID=869555 RepID=A0ABS4I5P3_9BACL|nr:6-phosphogluconolactonase [Paenibacillus aceris]NHW33391.1 lactonase family protein [Paenibacillus aceris]
MSGGEQKEMYGYIGSYTNEDNKSGITLFKLDRQSGAVTLLDGYTDLQNASFFALNADRTVLYAVSETNSYLGGFGGSAAAYAIEAGSGKLTKLNQQPTGGSAPCYISLDQTNRAVFVANYSSGSVTSFKIEADGKLSEPTQLVEHEGTLGPRADRQERPHAHSIVPAPDNRYAISADLGLDRLVVSRIDAESGTLQPHGEAAMKPGAGPRHLVYSSDSRHVYAINELDSTVTVLAYDASAGTLTALQSVSTLPEGFSGENTCADIHLSRDGRHVYASNRGHDSVAVYAVDGHSGKLSVVGWQATLGRTPRNFALSPQGDFLLAANQGSNSITVFRVDAETGMLQETGQTAAISKPVCVKFL